MSIFGDVVDHTRQSWTHVWNGNSTISEKLEVGGEVLLGVAVVAAALRYGVLRRAAKAEGALPEIGAALGKDQGLIARTGTNLLPNIELIATSQTAAGRAALANPNRLVPSMLNRWHIQQSLPEIQMPESPLNPRLARDLQNAGRGKVALAPPVTLLDGQPMLPKHLNDPTINGLGRLAQSIGIEMPESPMNPRLATDLQNAGRGKVAVTPPVTLLDGQPMLPKHPSDPAINGLGRLVRDRVEDLAQSIGIEMPESPLNPRLATDLQNAGRGKVALTPPVTLLDGQPMPPKHPNDPTINGLGRLARGRVGDLAQAIGIEMPESPLNTRLTSDLTAAGKGKAPLSVDLLPDTTLGGLGPLV